MVNYVDDYAGAEPRVLPGQCFGHCTSGSPKEKQLCADADAQRYCMGLLLRCANAVASEQCGDMRKRRRIW
jgi:hypothetical protein